MLIRLLFFVSIASLFTNLPIARADRPNIILIVADDLGWGDVGWHNSDIKTPHLDKLANAGARLEAFYVQPVCSPTRAALLTGRYPMRHGLQTGVVRPWAQYGLPLEEQTVAQGLQSAGYYTAISGKWHLGHFSPEYLPTRRGFDSQYGHYNGALDYFTHIRDNGFDWHRNDQVSRDEGYSTHLIAKEAVRVVKEIGGVKPFFLYVPFNGVHTPHQVPNEYMANYSKLKGERKKYAGMLTALDEAVGQIADAVAEKDLNEKTLFIFTADNGGPQPGVVTSNGHLRAGKGTLYEGGVNAAAFATWQSRIKPGTVVKEPLHAVDLYPTLLKLAGANVEQKLPLDGLDAWPTIAEDKPSPHQSILINTTPNSGAIRSGTWKLVVNGARGSGNTEDEPKETKQGNESLELFNLQEDPSEKTNLASQYPERVAELRARLELYAKQAVPPKATPKPKNFQTPEVWGNFSKKKLTSANIEENKPDVGDKAPAFESTDDQGKPWKLNDHLGKKTIVIYFYPADFTGGCTKQACAFRDDYSVLLEKGVEVVGVSGDTVEAHQLFKKHHNLKFTLLSDPDGKLAELLGVPVTRESKSVKAKVDDQEYTLNRNISAKRWTFVIDKEGRIIAKNTQVAAADDSKNILEIVSKLPK